MKTSHGLYLILLAGSVLVGCTRNGALTREEMTAIVKERNDRLGHLFVKGDPDSLGLMYAPEARLCMNGLDFVTGRAAIADFWKSDMKATVTHEMRTETLTVSGVNEVIYETGRTHLKMTFADSTFHLTVKYCNVWRRQPDGIYLLDVDIANRDAR